MSHLSEDQRRRGVVACSAGNHAQGVAYSSKILKISSKIFMPIITPNIKVENVKRLGAEVILTGNALDEAMEACKKCAVEENRTIIHPFDDTLVIAGQGTIGLELTKQIRSERVDAVFIGCGGGGMLAGVGGFLKSIAPHIKIIGVEAADAPGMTESLRKGSVVSLKDVGTFADGAAVRTVGEETFKYAKHVVDEMIVVSTDEICAAIKDVFCDVRVVLEPAGALAIAGLKRYVMKYGVTDKTMIATLSGANIDFSRLRFVSERADTTEHLISVVIPERPGSLRKMFDLIFPSYVTEVSYRHCNSTLPNSSAYVMTSFRAYSKQEADGVIAKLRDAGYSVMNLDDNEMAKIHGRHMVGGRSNGAENEELFRFEFPETQGALKRFLHNLGKDFNHNVSMCHYRNHGSDVARVLVGIQSPPERRHEFQVFLERMRSMGYTYVKESDNEFYRNFLTAPSKR